MPAAKRLATLVMVCSSRWRGDASWTVLVLTLLAGASARAEDAAESFGWLMPVIVPYTVGASASADRQFPEPLKGQAGTFARTTTRVSLKGQPWSTDHDEVQLTASATRADIDSDARFPKTGPLPDLLFDGRVGATYRHVADDRSLWGASAGIGSSSDHPFSSGSLAVSASVFYRVPVRESDAWILSLVYSNDRAVFNNVPFPVLMYQWTASPSTTVILGLPLLAVIWKPSPRYGGELFATGFGSAHLGGSASPFESASWLRFRAAFDYGGEVYRRTDAPDQADRIIFREVRLTAGVALEKGRSASAYVYGGYATHRQIIEAHSLFDHDNRIDIAGGPVFGASASVRF